MANAEAGRIEKALVLIVAFVGFGVGYACTYASTSTTFILPLTQAFGWGRLIPSLMYVGAMLGVIVASFFLGRLVERFGEARIAAVSGICLAIVMVLLSIMAGEPAVAIGLALLAGLLGAGTGVGLYVTMLPKWFDRNLGLALGVAVVGQSVGSAIMPPISAAIIAGRGWRSAYLVMAAIEVVVTLIVAIVLARLLKMRKQRAQVAAAQAQDGFTLGEAIRLRSFWILGGAVFLQTVGMFGVFFHLFPIYNDLGMAWADLPRITIAAAIGMVIGRLVSGVLLDRVEPRFVALGMFIVGAIAVAWIATLTGTAMTSGLRTYLPPALIGVALGSESDILAYFTRRLYGMRHYSVIYNRLLACYFLGTMTGPFLLGWAFDYLSDPRMALWGFALCCAISAAMALFLPPVGHRGRAAAA